VILAAINGPAYGGGLALACAADIRIAGASARLCSASIRTGLSGAECGLTYLLPHLIGNSRAFDLSLTGRDIDAAEAFQMGLVSKVVPDAELSTVVDEYTARMVSYTWSGLKATKDLLWNNSKAVSLESALELEIQSQNMLQHAPDVREYMASYRTRITGQK
jgi:enoyl-CoA hydratase